MIVHFIEIAKLRDRALWSEVYCLQAERGVGPFHTPKGKGHGVTRGQHWANWDAEKGFILSDLKFLSPNTGVRESYPEAGSVQDGHSPTPHFTDGQDVILKTRLWTYAYNNNNNNKL